MKETIQVKNVGALKDTGIIDIRPLTILIGNSASGKSTLMKLIVLMRYIYKRVTILSYIRNSNVTKKVFYIRPNDFLRDDMKSLVKKDSYLRYTIEVNEHVYAIVYADGKWHLPKHIVNADLEYTKEVWVSEMRSAIAPLISRGSFAKNASLGFYFDETFKDFDLATDFIKQYNLDYVGLKMSVMKGGNHQKKFELAPVDGSYEPFELRNASSGIQTTAPLLALIKYFATEFSFKAAQKRNIIDVLFEKDLTTEYQPEIELADIPKIVHFHIEEPELSLDPTSQLHFFNEIVRQSFYAAIDRKVELVLATHSPYIANDINLLLKAHDCGNDVDGAHLDFEDLSMYLIQDGGIEDLKLRNIHYVNTERLSRDINVIYDQYQNLKDRGNDEAIIRE